MAQKVEIQKASEKGKGLRIPPIHRIITYLGTWSRECGIFPQALFVLGLVNWVHQMAENRKQEHKAPHQGSVNNNNNKGQLMNGWNVATEAC